MNFFGCIPRFVKDHAGWILTGLGTAGFIGTMKAVSDEAPAARDAIDIAQESGKELTLWEKTKIVAPIYAPSLIFGAGSLACFWGAQIFNVKANAAILAAYGALATQFDQYRQVIRDEYGEEADRKALISAQAEIKRLRELNAEMMAENHQLYGFAWLPGVVIEANPRDIIDVLGQFNRNLVIRGYNDLCELNQFLDIPEMCYDKELTQKYGWNDYEDEVTWGTQYIDFEFHRINTPHGSIKIIHTPMNPPYRLDVNYGERSSCDEENLCPFYEMPKAIELAKQIGANDIIETAHPAAHYPVYCIG